jgi:hypothetical protein
MTANSVLILQQSNGRLIDKNIFGNYKKTLQN